MKCRGGYPSTLVLLAALALSACARGGTGDAGATAATPSLDSRARGLEGQGTPPAPGGAPAGAATAVPTPIRFALPTAGLSPVSAWRPPPYPAPWAIRPGDHFYFARPIPSGNVNWAHPLYRYGNTYFGEESTHTGIDLGADRDTPVLAAGAGEVVWAGYGLYRGSYDTSDPYGLAIAIRHDFGYEDQQLFTIYAHLGEVSVWEGERVSAGQPIGVVGDTGHASGPHLHFEVRIGANGYFATRNPELWVVPPEGWGVLAGRVMDAEGDPLPEQSIVVRSLETNRRWEVWTYVSETVRSDDELHENFAISDLPAGPYELTINYHDGTYTAGLLVRPGQTNFLVFRGSRGFTIEPTPIPPNLSVPPTPP